MNKENIIKKLNALRDDSIETALPYLINMLPNIFINGLCVSLPTIGAVCLDFKNNRDLRILEERVKELEEKQQESIYIEINKICNNELILMSNESCNDVYKIEYMELFLDETAPFGYEFKNFDYFLDNFENPLLYCDDGYVWISGNKITVNIQGHITKYSNEFYEIIEYINELLYEADVSFMEDSIKRVKCY